MQALLLFAPSKTRCLSCCVLPPTWMCWWSLARFLLRWIQPSTMNSLIFVMSAALSWSWTYHINTLQNLSRKNRCSSSQTTKKWQRSLVSTSITRPTFFSPSIRFTSEVQRTSCLRWAARARTSSTVNMSGTQMLRR